MIAAIRRRLGDDGIAAFDWRDPLRMTVAALLAFGAARLLHLPEGYWAVLSALIVSRPHRGGSMQAGAGRLLGTLAGVGWAMVVISGRHWQIAEGLLLAALLVPLALLVAWRAEWRTAPIAAVIVLSAAAQVGGGATGAAALRVAEIALGGGIGIAVAWLLLPSGSLRLTERLAADLLVRLADLLDAGDDNGIESCRRLLMRLTGASRAVRWEGGDRGRATQLAGLAARLQADVVFLRRCMAAVPGDAAATALLRNRCGTALLRTAAVLRGESGVNTDDAPWPISPPDTAVAQVAALLDADADALQRLAKKWRLPQQPPRRGEEMRD